MSEHSAEPKYQQGVTSKASIFKHPLHPLIVTFPIAFWVGALVTDIAYAINADPFWARASLWLIGAGVVMGAIAAALGLIDFIGIPRARELTLGWVHFLGNGLAETLAIINLIIRIGNPEAAVLPTGIFLSAVVAVLLVITGYAGGELAYRYKIGVVNPEE